jgi:flavin reductase (DIM6/NTAB) family NADH-FMN oxidoreductase RutF
MVGSTPTPELFRRVLGAFATGVTVITAERAPGEVHGMTANAFASVSLDPPLVLVCVGQNARLLSYLKTQRRFGLSILRDSQQRVSEFFAEPQQDPAGCARLGIRYRWTESGIPLLEDALAYLTCSVVAQYMAGDHTIFIGEVESLESAAGEPLLYLRGQYRRIRP